MGLARRTSSLPEANQLSHIFGNTEQPDRDLACSLSTYIASEPLSPRETGVGTLCTGQDDFRVVWRSCGQRQQAYLSELVSHELEAGTTMLSPAPISPEERSRSDDERMQKHTHLARLRSSVAVPLTLVAQRTGTATADTGSIDYA